MKISFRNHETRLAGYLPGLKASPLSYESLTGLPARTIRRRVPVFDPPADLRECDLDFLFRYDIFPPEILTFFGEWQLDGRAMEVGDVIAQQAQIPPGVGIRLLFGVRVLSVYRSATRAGFSYGTLSGHPETGTNEFSLSVEGGALFASVHTAAAPGLFVTRLLAPVVTRPYVASCNARALRRMEVNFLTHNPQLTWRGEYGRAGRENAQARGRRDPADTTARRPTATDEPGRV